MNKNNNIDMWDKTHYNIDEGFEIILYQKENGDIPVYAFISSLNSKMQIRTIACIDKLKKFGCKSREPLSKKIDKDIFELRIIQGNDISRILYFFFEGKKIILTNGFIKKSNKTPRKEIAKANTYRKDWIRRNIK